MNNPARSGMLLLASASCLMAVAHEPDLLRLAEKAPPVALKDALVERAVRETIAESKDEAKGKAKDSFGTEAGNERALSGDKYTEFGRQFSEAQIPGCLGPDALKHQPAGFSTRNWNFELTGLLALPFWGAAIVRGKCK
jgi:hypothetical protein